MRWAAFSPVSPSFVDGRANIHPDNLSTQSKKQSKVSPCQSTKGMENMSNATENHNFSGTGLA